jgi:hypothetical protein
MDQMDWKQIITQEDADQLLADFWGFHDCCIREGHLLTDIFVEDSQSMTRHPGSNYRIRLHIQSQMRPLSSIELRFEGVIRFNLAAPPENVFPVIYRATLIVQEEAIYWADYDGSWKPYDADNADYAWVTWISARALFWRPRNHLGEDPIYDRDWQGIDPPNNMVDKTGPL